MAVLAETYSEDATRCAAARFAKTLAPGDIVALTGPLGSGKTCFARGVIDSLHGAKESFQGSPTFALIQEYAGKPAPVFHFDFYRIKNAREIYDLGWDEYCSRGGICLVEWADRFPDVFPRSTKWLRFSFCGPTCRIIKYID